MKKLILFIILFTIVTQAQWVVNDSSSVGKRTNFTNNATYAGKSAYQLSAQGVYIVGSSLSKEETTSAAGNLSGYPVLFRNADDNELIVPSSDSHGYAYTLNVNQDSLKLGTSFQTNGTKDTIVVS